MEEEKPVTTELSRQSIENSRLPLSVGILQLRWPILQMRSESLKESDVPGARIRLEGLGLFACDSVDDADSRRACIS